ncbi:cytochrome P450 [Ktedonosporobacter rubrisoli]|nr:cytochrome P450 [Ktedonosporobacter rubrisoli]
MALATGQVPKKVIPAPESNFFVGNIFDLQRDPMNFYLYLHKTYGDIVRFRVFANIYVYLIFHPDDIDYTLRRNHQNYHRGVAHRRLRSLLGDGLLTSEGKAWLHERRLMQPAFHRQRIASFASLMTTLTETMLERWQTLQEPTILDIPAEMMNLALQIVGQALFSTNTSQKVITVGKALTTALEHINHKFYHFTWPDFIPVVSNRRYKQALHTLDSVVQTIIQERRLSKEDHEDLLSILLNARDETTGEGMSDQQLRDEVMTLILAGHETTASTLAWAWYLLSQHPKIESKLHAELASVLGGRTPTLDDLPQLPYSRMIIDEVLRLYPPSWGMSRRTHTDDEIRGYHIPANSEIAIVQYVTHRHPDFWERPEEFDPERFAPAHSAQRPHFAYFPFGGGPRLCIGNNFALMEAQLALATIAQRYRFLPLTERVVKPEPLVTLRMQGGLRMLALKRR